MKKQVKIYFILTLLGVLFSGCSNESVNGKGAVIEEERSVGDFNSVSLQIPGKLYVYAGTESSVIIKTNENVLHVIETTVINGKLIIETQPNISIRNTDVLNVYITSDMVTDFSINGSGKISIEDCIEDTSMKFEVNGSGDIIACGVTEVLNVVVNGSGQFKGFSLQAETAELNIRGSGDIESTVSEVLEADISGSGKIEYYGSPEVHTQISGSGTIKRKN